jgi:hypothetical protein
MIGFRIQFAGGNYISPKVMFFVFVVPVLLIITYAILKSQVLPPRFFFDEGLINIIMNDDAAFVLGDSYRSTAAFFNFFGFERGSYTLSIISIFIIYFTLSSHIRKSGLKSIDLIEYVLFIFLFFLMATYMTMLSKELIVFLLMIPFLYFASKGYKGLIVWSIIALVYAAYFRSYWFLIIGFFWAILLVMRVGRRNLILYTLVPGLLLVLSFMFFAVLGLDLDHFRTTVNDYRLENLDQNARTIILPFIDGGGPIISWVNSLITWFFLMFPVPLFLMLTPYYIVNSMLISFLFMKTLVAIKTEYVNKHSFELSAAASIIMAFTAIQAIFEPDYGSYVKHLAPIYPLFFYLILKARYMRLSEQT